MTPVLPPTPTDRRLAMQQAVQQPIDSKRYAKSVQASKRVRFDIDQDVIRGRTFDFAKKFLPDGLSKVQTLTFLSEREKQLVEPDPGPQLREHLRPGRALHRREGARGEPRALVRRPGRARGAGALHRRGDQAPGDVPPHRADGRPGHARGLHVPARAERGRRGRAQQVDLGGARADLPHRDLRPRALPREHRPGPEPLRPVEGRVPAPHARGVAARDPGRAGVVSARTRSSRPRRATRPSTI